MPDPAPHPSSDHRTWGGFWTTLPGILTGLAALITAIIGLISLLRESSPAPSDAGTPPAVRVTESASAGSGASPAPSAPGVLTEGRITMRSGDSVDLETGVTGDSPDGLDLYLFCTGTNCILNAMGSLMTATETADSRESCVGALEVRQEQALESTELRAGRVLCLQTTDGHVGRLQLIDVPRPGSVDFVFSYTLWR